MPFPGRATVRIEPGGHLGDWGLLGSTSVFYYYHQNGLGLRAAGFEARPRF